MEGGGGIIMIKAKAEQILLSDFHPSTGHKIVARYLKRDLTIAVLSPAIDSRLAEKIASLIALANGLKNFEMLGES